MKTTYDDIIDLPHHVSKVHPQMSMYNRTAQFAPFAALTGHEDAIRETARQTDEDKELSESEAEILNRKLTYSEKGRKADCLRYLFCRGRQKKRRQLSHSYGNHQKNRYR